MRSPHCASRISLAKPCSSTPARIRASTCSRLDFSRMTVSMPCRCRSCDSRSPDGPPPMMQTWTFTWTSSTLVMSCSAWTFLVEFATRRMDEISKLLYNSNMRRVATPRSIQTYNLFGEAGDLPDVVHCETIAARSVLHDWTFPPHRHARLHQILLIERGGGEATLEGRRFALKPM